MDLEDSLLEKLDSSSFTVQRASASASLDQLESDCAAIESRLKGIEDQLGIYHSQNP